MEIVQYILLYTLGIMVGRGTSGIRYFTAKNIDVARTGGVLVGVTA